MTYTLEQFRHDYPFAQRFPELTQEMVDILVTTVISTASNPRDPWGTADILFDLRASPLTAGLTKARVDIVSRLAGHVARVAGDRVVVSGSNGNPLKRVIHAVAGDDKAKVTATVRNVPGRVGLFFAVPTGGALHLLVLGVPLTQADIYGENLTVERGHDDVWGKMAAMGKAGLSARNLPLAPLTNDYYAFPRGRMVYSPLTEEFTLLADRRLHSPQPIANLNVAFITEGQACRVVRDDHYRTTAPLPATRRIVIHHLHV